MLCALPVRLPASWSGGNEVPPMTPSLAGYVGFYLDFHVINANLDQCVYDAMESVSLISL